MAEDVVFVGGWFAEVEGTAGRLRQVAFRPGDRLAVVARTVRHDPGRGDTADLHLADGSTARHVPLSRLAIGPKRRAA